MRKSKPKLVTLTCVDCGVSKSFPFTSPAAPKLSACEELEKEGWSFVVGFFAMLTGEHENRCPSCSPRRRPSTKHLTAEEVSQVISRGTREK